MMLGQCYDEVACLNEVLTSVQSLTNSVDVMTYKAVSMVWILTGVLAVLSLIWGGLTWKLIVYAKNHKDLWCVLAFVGLSAFSRVSFGYAQASVVDGIYTITYKLECDGAGCAFFTPGTYTVTAGDGYLYHNYDYHACFFRKGIGDFGVVWKPGSTVPYYEWGGLASNCPGTCQTAFVGTSDCIGPGLVVNLTPGLCAGMTWAKLTVIDVNGGDCVNVATGGPDPLGYWVPDCWLGFPYEVAGLGAGVVIPTGVYYLWRRWRHARDTGN